MSCEERCQNGCESGDFEVVAAALVTLQGSVLVPCEERDCESGDERSQNDFW